MYGITLGFAIASAGFGLFRPGFTSGASLAVAPRRAECGRRDGHLGQRSRLYRRAGGGGSALRRWMPLPFVATAAGLLVLALWVRLRVKG